MWCEPQVNPQDCFKEQNGDVENRHTGAIRNREHKLSRKTLTQKCCKAMCTHVSQCQRDTEHIGPDTKVLCPTGDAQAPENLIIWYLPQSSWRIKLESLSTILSLELEVCLACHHENPACWLICLSRPLWCTLVLLLVCLAADCVLLLISSEKWPGSATVQRTVEPEIQNRVSVGFRKCWRKLYQKHGPNHCQISANVLVELEKNIISLPSLFFETEEIAVEIMLSCLDKMNWQVLASPISCVVHQVAVTLHALTSYPKELTVIAVIFCVGS